MVKRKHNAPRREAQARETRAAVIAAGHRMFLEKGYAGASLREIAAEAQVGEQTIYRVFGTKAELLRQVILTAVSGNGEDGMEALLASVSGAETSLDALRAIGRWSAAIYERGTAELEDVLFAAAQSDPILADVAASLNQQRYEAVRMLADAVLGDVRPPQGIARSDLADYIYATWSAPVYRQLVKERGWPIEKYIDYCILMVQRTFVADGA